MEHPSVPDPGVTAADGEAEGRGNRPIILAFLLALSLGACAQVSSFTQQDAATAAQIDPVHAACYRQFGDLAGTLAEGGGLLTAIAVKERAHDLLRGACAPVSADIAITAMRLRAHAWTSLVPLVAIP